MPNGLPDELLQEDVQTPDPGVKLERRYRMLGRPPLFGLLRRIRPVVLLDDVRSGIPGQFQPDPTVAEFERPCSGFVASSPAAGQVARAELTNPTGSGVFCIVEDLIARTDAAFNVNIIDVNKVVAGAITNTAGIEYRDTRIAGTPVCAFRISSVAFALSARWQIMVGAPLNRPIALPYVLEPGNALRFQGGTIDVPVQVGLRWRERAI